MPYSSVLERASGTHKYSVQQELSLLTSTCSVVCLLPQAYSNKLRLAALEVPGFIFLWCLGAQRKGMVINMEFPFYDAPNTAAIICCHIMESKSPILYVSHDEDDGMWQFLCGQVHTTDEAKLVSLRWVFDFDHSVGVLADMPCGYYAQRKNRDDSWTIKKR